MDPLHKLMQGFMQLCTPFRHDGQILGGRLAVLAGGYGHPGSRHNDEEDPYSIHKCTVIAFELFYLSGSCLTSLLVHGHSRRIAE